MHVRLESILFLRVTGRSLYIAELVIRGHLSGTI